MSTLQGVVQQVLPGWAWGKSKRLGATRGCGCYDHCHTIEGGNKSIVRPAFEPINLNCIIC